MAALPTQDSIVLTMYPWYFSDCMICMRSSSDIPGGRGSCPGRYTGATRGILLAMVAVFRVRRFASAIKLGQFVATQRTVHVTQHRQFTLHSKSISYAVACLFSVDTASFPSMDSVFGSFTTYRYIGAASMDTVNNKVIM